MIGCGPGIYSTFGWKPVGKYEIAGATSLVMNPFPVDANFKGTVKIIGSMALNLMELCIRFANDTANNHEYSINYGGTVAGSNTFANTFLANSNEIRINRPGLTFVGFELTIKVVHDGVWVTGQSFGYTDTINLLTHNFGGLYWGIPFNRIDIINLTSNVITGNVEVFKSVYNF